MKYIVKWTESYETQVEAPEGLSDMEVYDLIDFDTKNQSYTGLDDLDVELSIDEECGDNE